MKRRTISLPEAIDALIRSHALPGESYSGTVARLVEEGASIGRGRKPPGFVGIADGDGPDDLSRRTEEYLRESLAGS